MDNQNVITGTDLLKMEQTEVRYILEPVLPRIGTGILVGRPDTGKSQLARQFTISVAKADSDFLGFKLNCKHGRSIYVATEDDPLNTSFLLNKQVSNATIDTDNIRFIFADLLSQNELIKLLDKQISKEPVDLVVVDAFGDVFQGSDSNNNMAMRNTVKAFDKVAKKHSCFLLFVHHINKAAYDQAPNQKHIQGGSGLAQKVRTAMQLSAGENDRRVLSITKGNYCPQQFKNKGFELIFDPLTFSFTYTGERTSFNEASASHREEEKLQTLMNIADLSFDKSDLFGYKDLTQKIEQVTGKGIATAKRYIKSMVEFEIIVKEKESNKYKLKNDE